MKFPISECTISSSGPPFCHAHLICCRSNYLYCFVGSFISSPNSLAPSSLSLSLCLTVFWVLLTLQVQYVLYIWSAVGDEEIRSMAAASSRQQLSSIQMRRPTDMVREGTNWDRLEKKMGESTQCVQILLKVCKLSVFVPKSLMLKVCNFSLAI